MVYCPMCSGTSHTIDSRDASHNRTYRRRVCDNCGNRYTTFEIGTEDPTSYTSYIERAEKAEAIVERVREVVCNAD